MTRCALLLVLALLPARASAQDAFTSGHLTGVPDDGGEFLDVSEGTVAGPCGELIRRHAVIVSDEVDGRAFRGVGAPGRGSEVQLDLWGGALAVGSTDAGFAGEASVRTVLQQLYRRSCLTGQLRVPIPFGSLGAYTLGNPTAELGVLVRSPLDGFRFELGVTLAMPSLGAHAENALSLQTGYHAALLSGNHDELGWLPMLEWGGKVRGRLHVQTIAGPRTGHLGLMADLTLNLGLARLSSALGPREGLVGGVRFVLGGEWRPPMQNDSRGVPRSPRLMPVNLGIAGEARLGFGSLWPTDVLLPLYFGGRVDIGLAWEELGNPELSLTAGAVFPQLFLDEGESYFQMGLSIVFAIDASIGRRGTSIESPRAAEPDSAFLAAASRDDTVPGGAEPSDSVETRDEAQPTIEPGSVNQQEGMDAHDNETDADESVGESAPDDVQKTETPMAPDSASDAP